MLRLIHMQPVTESEAKVIKNCHLLLTIIFMTVFIREHRWRIIPYGNASVVAATHGCKILQLYEYEENEHGYGVKCE